MDEPDFRLWQRLERIPMLGLLGMAAALVDLAFPRLVLRFLNERVSPETLISLGRLSDLPRNLFAICGIIALLTAVMPLMTIRGPAAIARSVGLAGFLGFFVLTVTLATLTPAEVVTKAAASLSLFVASLAANFLVVLLALTAFVRASPRGIRASLVLIAIVALLGVVPLTVALIPGLTRSTTLLFLSNLFRSVTELAFVALPFFMTATLIRPIVTERRWVALLPAVIVLAAVSALFIVGMRQVTDFRSILYGAFGWDGLLDSAAWLYAIPLAVYCAAATIALCQSDHAIRQIGAGLALVVAGGLAPTTLARLLMWTLGVALIARSSIVLGERIIAQRTVLQPKNVRSPTNGDATDGDASLPAA